MSVRGKQSHRWFMGGDGELLPARPFHHCCHKSVGLFNGFIHLGWGSHDGEVVGVKGHVVVGEWAVRHEVVKQGWRNHGPLGNTRTHMTIWGLYRWPRYRQALSLRLRYILSHLTTVCWSLDWWMLHPGGFFMLNPSETRETNRRKADTQECLGLKPCWETRVSRASVRNGRSRRSKIFTAGHSKEIGRYEAPSILGPQGFKIGMIVELFQREGRLIPPSEKLKSYVRKARPETPRCFRWATVSPSGILQHIRISCRISSLI